MRAMWIAAYPLQNVDMRQVTAATTTTIITIHHTPALPQTHTTSPHILFCFTLLLLLPTHTSCLLLALLLNLHSTSTRNSLHLQDSLTLL